MGTGNDKHGEVPCYASRQQTLRTVARAVLSASLAALVLLGFPYGMNTDAESLESFRAEAASLFDGDPRDKARAINLYEQAASSGDTASMVFLARLYESGDGVTADRQKAIDWYAKASAAGNAEATGRLAQLAAQGSNATSKVDQTPSSASSQANADDLLVQAKDAFDFDSTKNNEAIALFEQAASAGNDEAADWLTSIYYIPMGITKPNYKRARQWGLQAAGGGFSGSMIFLANMYADGQGGPKDTKKYFEWMEKAADLGEVGAYFQLGNVYYNGILVKKGSEEGVRLSAEGG